MFSAKAVGNVSNIYYFQEEGHVICHVTITSFTVT